MKERRDITFKQAMNEIREYVESKTGIVSHAELREKLHINFFMVNGVCRQLVEEGLLNDSVWDCHVFATNNKRK